MVNKTNVHWVALIIDFNKSQILYGDSIGRSIDKQTRQVLDWWVSYHTGGWEEQCEQSFLRKAWVIKEEDIPAALLVNSDQTQVVFAPGDKMSWAETGSKQVAILGGEKRAFTVLISVASNGAVLPMQAIYTGKTPRSRPSMTSPHHADLIAAGFLLQESGTTTYWSNLETMKVFVNKILAPYFERVKVELKLPATQKSLWIIDSDAHGVPAGEFPLTRTHGKPTGSA